MGTSVLAWKELRRNGRFASLLVLNLFLGIFGVVSLLSLRASIEATLDLRSKALLGADIGISSRRDFSETEWKIIRSRKTEGDELTVSTELYSMVSSSSGSKLAEVRALEDAYPFFGEISLRHGGNLSGGTPKSITRSREAWVAPELLIQLGVKVGDKVRIGESEFKISDVIREDEGNAWRGFRLAPPVLIGMPFLADTGLTRGGSLLTRRALLKLKNPEQVEDVRSVLLKSIPDPGVRINSHRTESEQVARALNYVQDYMALVALVALFLSAIGAAYLFESFLESRLKDVATLVTLGLTRSRAIWVSIIQLAWMGAFSGALAVGVCRLALPFALSLMRPLFEFPVSPVFPLWVSLASVALGVLASLLSSLPLVAQISSVRLADLFQEATRFEFKLSRSVLLYWIPGALAFYGLTCWQAHSVWVGSIFMLCLLAGGLGLTGLFSVLLPRFAKFEFLKLPTLTLAFRAISRNRLSSISLFLALSLLSLLTQLIPQLEGSIQGELDWNSADARPSLFLFDIQDEQRRELEKWMAGRGAPLENASPLIRARLVSINAVAIERDSSENWTREGERESQSRNRSYNLTIRSRLSAAETLVQGRDFGSAAGEISLEKRFAERIHARLGDVLEFDVQGVRIKGPVVNLRRVRWTSFQPNFFIAFSPGTLDDAPKTWLASVPKLDSGAKAKFQQELSLAFPNVSAVDVESTLQRIAAVFSQMSRAIQLMALLVLVSSVMVLVAIALHQSLQRRAEMSLLKILGAKSGQVLSAFVFEFLSLSILAGALGSFFSLGVGLALSHWVFDGAWAPHLRPLLLLNFSLIAVTTAVSLAVSLRVFGAKPLSLLQNNASQ